MLGGEKMIKSSMSIEQMITQLEYALNIASIGLWEWDIESKEVYLDNKCLELLGISNYDCTMSFILDFVIHNESIKSFEDALSRAVEEGSITNGIYRVNSSSKNEKWVKVYSHPEYANEKIVKLSGLMMDVSKDVAREKEMEKHLDFKDSILSIISYPIFYKNREGKYKYFNKAFEEFLGLSYDEIMDKSVYEVSPKHLADIYHKADEDLMHNKGTQVYETTVKYSDGSSHDVVFNKTVHLNEKGDVRGLVGVMQDITDQRQYQQKLEKLYEAKDILLKLSREVHLFNDERLFLNAVLERFINAFSNIDSAVLLHLKDQSTVSLFNSLNIIDEGLVPSIQFEKTALSIMIKRFDEVGIFNDLHLDDYDDDDPGKDFLMMNPAKSMMLIPVKERDDSIWFFMYFSNEKGAFKKEDQILSEYVRQEMIFILQFYKLYQDTLNLSRYDGLTGLMNRAYFDSVFESEIARAEKDNDNFQLVIFDLDNLKSVNDILGHTSGDRYIDILSRYLKEYFASDLIGRIGGDEFACISKCKTLEKDIEEMRARFSEDINTVFVGLKLGFSYGISKFPIDGKLYKELFKSADANMYQDKKRNKNKINESL